MLILAATPIGNLKDASPRLIEALETVRVVASEDTRTTVRLLTALGIANRPRLIALHDHNEKEKAAELAALASEQNLLVVSDAGMPTVSDPGFGLVSAAIAAGVEVSAIPGPSAVVTALAISGLPTDRFTFEGFLPRKAGERNATLRALANEQRTMVFFEAPSRVAASLGDMEEVFGAGRRAAVCRELTKRFEEVVRATLAELVEWAAGGVRGELVVVVDGAGAREVVFDDAVAQVGELVATGVRLKDAAGEVSAQTGHSSRELYQASLAARRSGNAAR